MFLVWYVNRFNWIGCRKCIICGIEIVFFVKINRNIGWVSSIDCYVFFKGVNVCGIFFGKLFMILVC